MKADTLPAPLVPASVDLRDFEYMPLHVARLRDAETTVKTNGDEFRCAVLLWSAAWHQVPAASLPDDELVLADLAGFGRVVREWRKVRAGALRGFVKCSDGRLYHRVVAEVAINSWLQKLKHQYTSACNTLRKRAQRGKQVTIPDFAHWLQGACPEAIAYLSQRQGEGVSRESHGDSPPTSQGQPPGVPRETPSNRSELNKPASTTGEERDSEARPVDNPQPPGENSKSKPRAPTRSELKAKAVIQANLEAAARALPPEAPLPDSVAKHIPKRQVDGFTLTDANGEVPWWITPSGITNRGHELGIDVGSDDFEEFKSRVIAASGPGPWDADQPPHVMERVEYHRAFPT